MELFRLEKSFKTIKSINEQLDKLTPNPTLCPGATSTERGWSPIHPHGISLEMKFKLHCRDKHGLFFCREVFLHSVESICLGKLHQFCSHFQGRDKASGQNIVGPSEIGFFPLFHSASLVWNPPVPLSNWQIDWKMHILIKTLSVVSSGSSFLIPGEKWLFLLLCLEWLQFNPGWNIGNMDQYKLGFLWKSTENSPCNLCPAPRWQQDALCYTGQGFGEEIPRPHSGLFWLFQPL